MRYMKNPTTIGEKIRNRRLELGLLQKDIADMIGICEDTVTYWENDRAEPLTKHYPKLIKFLGYIPFEIDTNTTAGKMKMYRFLNGLSQEDLAKELGINESTVFHYENGKHLPQPQTLLKMKYIIK